MLTVEPIAGKEKLADVVVIPLAPVEPGILVVVGVLQQLGTQGTVALMQRLYTLSANVATK